MKDISNEDGGEDGIIEELISHCYITCLSWISGDWGEIFFFVESYSSLIEKTFTLHTVDSVFLLHNFPLGALTMDLYVSLLRM